MADVTEPEQLDPDELDRYGLVEAGRVQVAERFWRAYWGAQYHEKKSKFGTWEHMREDERSGAVESWRAWRATQPEPAPPADDTDFLVTRGFLRGFVKGVLEPVTVEIARMLKRLEDRVKALETGGR